MTYSIRTRLTLWYGGLMASALIVLSAGVLWLHMRWGLAQFDGELSNLGATVVRVMQEELGERGNFQRAAHEAHESMGAPGRATAVLDLTGKPLVAEWQGLPYEPSMWTGKSGFATVFTGGHNWRLLVRREASAAGDYFVLVGGTLDEVERERSFLRRTLLMATPLIVLGIAAVCWGVASSALRPVTMMAAQAEALTEHSTTQVLDTPTAPDELGRLKRAFNRLLNRLGTALEHQRRFMADASHELRTPVSVIQTATEVTLEQPIRAESEYRDALTIINEQSARLRQMVEDMLVLARADAGGTSLTRSLLYLDDLVAECVRAVSVVAARRDVHLVTTLQPDVSLTADDGLLRQLVTDLLDNAVRYTPSGGAVIVTVSRDGTCATIQVSDTGPGIPEAERERVFERFVRLDPARSETSGAGLGLPIARWIAEQHDGTVTVERNSSGGALFVVRLPLTSPGPLQPREVESHVGS
ncbi:MAG TPA: ATP-binding protein [Vicinamibacterales bacterium]|nr:ATP-binding protein [Vicinamibacterales bacterium]